MSGYTKQNKIRNQYIREKVRVAPIVRKIVEFFLKWFGHMRKRSVEAPIR